MKTSDGRFFPDRDWDAAIAVAWPKLCRIVLDDKRATLYGYHQNILFPPFCEAGAVVEYEGELCMAVFDSCTTPARRDIWVRLNRDKLAVIVNKAYAEAGEEVKRRREAREAKRAALAPRRKDVVEADVQTLERRVAELEAKGIKYTGVWQRAMDYTRGDVVTHGGSAWVAVVPETRGTPGETNGWQLLVKGSR